MYNANGLSQFVFVAVRCSPANAGEGYERKKLSPLGEGESKYYNIDDLRVLAGVDTQYSHIIAFNNVVKVCILSKNSSWLLTSMYRSKPLRPAYENTSTGLDFHRKCVVEIAL